MLADAGSTPAASTKNKRGSPLGGPFLFLAAVIAEPAPEGKGRRAQRGVVSRPTACEAQTPAASTESGSNLIQRNAENPIPTDFCACHLHPCPAPSSRILAVLGSLNGQSMRGLNIS